MSTFRQLCRWRLGHFRATSFRLLARRWQTALFLLFLVSPALMPISEQLYWLGRPVAMIVTGAAWPAFGALLLVALCAWLWTGLQARALDGGAAWRHLCAMPMGAGMTTRVDLAVLGVADLPLLLPFAAAMFSLRATPVAVAIVAALAAQLPVAQALLLNGSRRAGYCLLFDVVGILLVAAGAPLWTFACMSAGGVGVGLVCLLWMPGPASAGALSVPLALRVSAKRSSVVNLAAINIRYLFSAAQLTQHLRLLVCMAWPILLNRVLSLTALDDSDSRTALLLLAWPLLIFNVAGLAINLTVLHAPMLSLHMALGVGERRVRAAAMLVLATLLSLACVPLAAILYSHGQSVFVLAMFPAAVAAMAVCVWLNVRARTQGFLPKVAIVALACAALLGLLSI